jgi:hypothetical protein
MKRSILILLATLMVCGLCSPAWATTWYAQGSTVNIDAFTSYKSTVWNDAANGSVSYPITCKTTGGVPISGVQVMISTDSAGTNMIRGPLWSDDNGVVNGLLLDPGTYYAWRSKAGYSFTNPHAITVP